MMKVHFYPSTEFYIRLWHPLDLAQFFLFSTIWRGHPAHCNIEIDGMFYDYNIFDGLTCTRQYQRKPMKTFVIDKSSDIVIPKQSFKIHKHPALPMILEILGIWPKWKKRPQTCVTVTCIILGIALDYTLPVQLMKGLDDGIPVRR